MHSQYIPQYQSPMDNVETGSGNESLTFWSSFIALTEKNYNRADVG